MTKREYARRLSLETTLKGLGFSSYEADALRRISGTLQRWHERECGIDDGCIERDEETGRPYWRSAFTGKRHRIADLERGAKRRLALIFDAVDKARRTAYDGDGLKPREALGYYIQTDPRGAALYILRPGDIPKGEDADAYYNRGVCVY